MNNSSINANSPTEKIQENKFEALLNIDPQNPPNFSMNNSPPPFSRPFLRREFSNSESDIISRGIKQLKNNKPHDCYDILLELSESFSIANESVINHYKIEKLINELINLFDKNCSAEILVQSLICLNYILDINPILARVLKNNGVEKLILQVQNFEYIDLSENAIKVLNFS